MHSINDLQNALPKIWVWTTPPTADELQALKNELGYTGKQMAALACVGEQHCRKDTGGAEPKDMPYPNLLLLAAVLELKPED